MNQFSLAKWRMHCCVPSSQCCCSCIEYLTGWILILGAWKTASSAFLKLRMLFQSSAFSHWSTTLLLTPCPSLWQPVHSPDGGGMGHLHHRHIHHLTRPCQFHSLLLWRFRRKGGGEGGALLGCHRHLVAQWARENHTWKIDKLLTRHWLRWYAHTENATLKY